MSRFPKHTKLYESAVVSSFEAKVVCHLLIPSRVLINYCALKSRRYEFNLSVHTAKDHHCQSLKRERNFGDRHLCSLQNRHEEQALREPLCMSLTNLKLRVLETFDQQVSARRDSGITDAINPRMHGVPLLVRMLETPAPLL